MRVLGNGAVLCLVTRKMKKVLSARFYTGLTSASTNSGPENSAACLLRARTFNCSKKLSSSGHFISTTLPHGLRADETCCELLILLTLFNIGMKTNDDWGIIHVRPERSFAVHHASASLQVDSAPDFVNQTALTGKSASLVESLKDVFRDCC